MSSLSTISCASFFTPAVHVSFVIGFHGQCLQRNAMTVRLVGGVTLPVSPLCSQENQRKVGDNIRSCEPMRVCRESGVAAISFESHPVVVGGLADHDKSEPLIEQPCADIRFED